MFGEMKRGFYWIGALAVLLAGCTDDYFAQEETPVPEGPAVRLAVSADETRASLDGLSVRWEAGDRIHVNGTEYPLQGSQTEGWYVEVAEADSYEAVYPASAVREDGSLMLPAIQNYAAGSFDAAAHLMTASSTGGTLEFRNQCALLKLSLTGGDASVVERIVLTGNGGEYLAGPGEKNDDTGLALREAEDAASVETVKWLRLDFGEEAALSSEPLVCYMVVPAGEFPNGFSLEIHTADGMMMEQRTLSAQTFARSQVLSMPAFEVAGTMRVLTFEDEDYKGDVNLTGEKNWSSLIDSEQYGGPLLYGGSALYGWNDANNTFLASQITNNDGTLKFWTGGCAVSDYIERDLANGDFNHQLAVWYQDPVTGFGGHNGSKNFCVQNGYRDFYRDKLPNIYFSDGVARVIDHMYVANTTYFINCIIGGNQFSTPFAPGDVAKIVATGFDSTGAETGTAELVLAQDADYVLTDWVRWDLSSLGEVTKVEFNITSTDSGNYGMNTPAYFAYDDVAVRW